MLHKESAQAQLLELRALDQAIFILLRFVHLMIDESIAWESDTNQLLWWLYGELSGGIYPQIHQYMLDLTMEMDVMYDDSPPEEDNNHQC
jgi:hypothetical protein